MTGQGARISLLGKLYAGQIPLGKVFWGYWLGLGLLTYLLWCLIVALPYMLLNEALFALIDHSADELARTFPEWRTWSRWIVLLLLPLFVAPGYALFHSVIMFLPLERSAKQACSGSFWSTRTGIVFCLLPLLVAMLPGIPLLLMGFMISLGGGLLSFAFKLLTFTLGLLPHAVLLLVLRLLPAEPLAMEGGAHE